MKAEIIFINKVSKENFFTGVEYKVKIILSILFAICFNVLFNNLVH